MIFFFADLDWNSKELSDFKDLEGDQVGWKVPVYKNNPVAAEFDSSKNGYTYFRNELHILGEQVVLEGPENPEAPDRLLTSEEVRELVEMQSSHQPGFLEFRNELIEHFEIYRHRFPKKVVPWLRYVEYKTVSNYSKPS